MIEADFSIWIASKTRWAHLTKRIPMPVLPRVGEFVKFRNEQLGGYFPWRVSEVTYREGGEIAVATELLDDIDGRGYSFETEEEFDEYLGSYLAEGWVCERGPRANHRTSGSLAPEEHAGATCRCAHS